MNANSRIRDAVRSGVKAKTIAKKAGISYYRISSAVNPEKYKGESKFNEPESERINAALDSIKNGF